MSNLNQKTVRAAGEMYERLDDYAKLKAYAEATVRVPPEYATFDRATVSDINLFSMRSNFDFDRLSDILNEMFRVLPSIKSVFAHPVIHLKDELEIMPVESVHVVNNCTILHASSHSELWGNLTDKGEIKPRRLLTRTSQDEYALYENIGFTKLILQMESFLRHNIHVMRDYLYADEILSRNLLERGSHLYYVLAIGKLRTGYMRGMEAYRDAAVRALERMEYLYDALTIRMKCPLIRQCAGRARGFVLHRSNLFRMHRDYQCIYRMLRFCDENGIGREVTDDRVGRISAEGYFAFCEAICLFAAGHFGFSPDPSEQTICFPQLDFRFTCGPWSLRLTVVEAEDKCAAFCPDAASRALLLEVCRERAYRILLIPNGGDMGKAFRAVCPADEYLAATPLSAGHRSPPGCVVLRLTDIESFRRVQQLLLRAMVYTAPSMEDGIDDVCPFCGHATEPARKTENGWIRECPACRTFMEQRRCPTTGLAYRSTGLRQPEQRVPRHTGDVRQQVRAPVERPDIRWEDAEHRMNYRNITDVTVDGSPICPRCGRVHQMPRDTSRQTRLTERES